MSFLKSFCHLFLGFVSCWLKCGGKDQSRLNAKGFSLIELMVTLFVVCILTMIATPSVSSWVDSSRAKTTRSQLLGTLKEARFTALTQAQTVTVCKLEADSCSKDFGVPLSAFIDTNSDAALGKDEQLIRRLDIELGEQIDLSWNRSGGYLRFWPSGATGALTGSISYCNKRSKAEDYRLVVARTGRVRIDENETRCPD